MDKFQRNVEKCIGDHLSLVILRNKHLYILVIIPHRILSVLRSCSVHISPLFHEMSVRNYLRPSNSKIRRTEHSVHSLQLCEIRRKEYIKISLLNKICRTRDHSPLIACLYNRRHISRNRIWQTVKIRQNQMVMWKVFG